MIVAHFQLKSEVHVVNLVKVEVLGRDISVIMLTLTELPNRSNVRTVATGLGLVTLFCSFSP